MSRKKIFSSAILTPRDHSARAFFSSIRRRSLAYATSQAPASSIMAAISRAHTRRTFRSSHSIPAETPWMTVVIVWFRIARHVQRVACQLSSRTRASIDLPSTIS
jgi:hypothetical protein